MDKMQWARGLFLFLTTCTWVLMTSPAVLSSDHSSSKASSVLLIAMSSIVAGQNTATVPSLSSVSMSSSKVFHSSTFAMSSSSFVALSSSMATPAWPLGSSKLVSSLPVVSKSVVRLSRPPRSESSPVAMSSSRAFEQGTSVLPSVSSWLLLSSAISLSSLHQSHLSFVVASTTLAIDKSTTETPSPSSILLASSTVVSQQSACTSREYLNGFSGFFSTPNFPSNFPQYSRCTWIITVPSGYIIKLSFFYFRLEPNQYSSCYYDAPGARVTVTNVASDDSYQPFMLCGQSLPPAVYSVGNSVQVIFTSLSSQHPGFNATYTAITYSSVCPNMATLNEASGVLTSPYYPRRYPSNEKCSWKITASKGERIVLVIEDLNIRSCGSSCSCDYLEIQNGSSSDGISGRRRCGYYEDRGIVYHSAKDFLRLTFVSDSGTYRHYRGFKATYIKVKYIAPTTACTSGEYLNEFSGFFSTPNFPNNYPQYSMCTWNITVPSGYIIKLSFLYFRLEPHQYSPCYYNAPGARVTVTNVTSDDGYQPFMLCGQQLPDPVYSVGNSMQVIFTSLSSQYSGFNATYTAITYSSVCPNMATLNETSGVLTSPYYPRRYPPNENCSWKITASKGEHIVLVIEDLNIKSCGSSCTCDYLEIQNGSSTAGISGRRRCRYYQDHGIVYHSAKDALRLTFVSDSDTYRGYRGFRAIYMKAKYNATTTACTSGEYLNGLSGFFSTPNFPSDYPQYSICIWNITVPSGYIIKLSFVDFQLEPHQYIPCYYNAQNVRVTVTNVASDGRYQPFMLCGQELPYPVYSVGNSMQVIFTSLRSQYSGFNATYTAITYSSVCPNMTSLNEISGVITSPFYPRHNPYNQSCSWEIRARKGKRILFTIEDIDSYWGCSGGWSCSCNYLEIQGGSISSHDGPKWRVCGLLTANTTYDWFKERIKVLFVFDGGQIQWGRGFKISYTQVNFSVSGCSNYTYLNESSRAMTYTKSVSYPCDANLNGWYRFTGEAGTQMADSCVNIYHCGTESPGWLNGTHPDLTDGAVKRQVCFSSFDNCCHHSNEITVQHCGAFYVYKLEGQSHCNLRNCGNGSPYARECYNYKVLNETSRSKTYHGYYHYQCDDMLSTDWYRFSGAAGNQMAESCVDGYRCGTYFPGWLNGSHPTLNEAAVQRRVCFGFHGHCCIYSTYIRVRNCGGFYVYQLKPLTVCYSRYCGNGYVSSTPTTPELPHASTKKVPPATGAPSTTGAETRPKRAMYSEPEHRSIVVIDIDKEIIDRRGSMRQKSCSK